MSSSRAHSSTRVGDLHLSQRKSSISLTTATMSTPATKVESTSVSKAPIKKWPPHPITTMPWSQFLQRELKIVYVGRALVVSLLVCENKAGLWMPPKQPCQVCTCLLRTPQVAICGGLCSGGCWRVLRNCQPQTYVVFWGACVYTITYNHAASSSPHS